MDNEMQKFNVLGEEWTLIYSDEETQPNLRDVSGFCDWTTREIFIDKNIIVPEDGSLHNLLALQNKVVRHEVIHAFIFESGLFENSASCDAWAINEEMVDWIAAQFPKILKVYQELGVL